MVSWYLLVMDDALSEEGTVFDLPDAVVLLRTLSRTLSTTSPRPETQS